MNPQKALGGAALLGGATYLLWPRKKEQAPSTATKQPCKGGYITATDWLELIDSKNPCVYQHHWTVHCKTFTELHSVGQFISGWMMQKHAVLAGADLTDDAKKAIDALGAWIRGNVYTLIDQDWVALQAKRDRLDLEFKAAVKDLRWMESTVVRHDKISLNQHVRVRADKAREALNALNSQLESAGSSEIQQHFLHVIKNGATCPVPLDQVTGEPIDKPGTCFLESPGIRYREDTKPPLYNPAESFLGGYCGQVKEQVYRDEDGWLLPTDNQYLRTHPYFQICTRLGDSESPSLSTEGGVPGMWYAFARYSETAVFEYASAHFAQYLYLSSLDLNATERAGAAGLSSAMAALAVVGAGITASTGGFGAIIGVATAVVGLIGKLFDLFSAIPAARERERQARLLVAQQVHGRLADLGQSVADFSGWRLGLIQTDLYNKATGDTSTKDRPWHMNRGGDLVYGLGSDGKLYPTQADRFIDVRYDPWFYFRRPKGDNSDPQIPLLLLRPDFDFLAYTRYVELQPTYLFGVRVLEQYATQEERDKSVIAGTSKVKFEWVRFSEAPEQLKKIRLPKKRAGQ